MSRVSDGPEPGGPDRSARVRRPYRAVLRAYPATYRRSHGDDLALTAHDLAGGRWSIREAASLLAGGLRMRAAVGCRGTLRGAWTSGLAAGLMGAMVLSVVVQLAGLWPPLSHPLTGAGAGQLVLSALAVAVLARTSGWPALMAVLAAQWDLLAQPGVIRGGWVTDAIWQHRVDQASALGLVLAAIVLALFGDHRPAARWTTTALVAVAAVPLVLLNIDLGAVMMLLLLGGTVVSIVLAPVDPRPALATAGFTLLAVVLPLAGRLSYALERPSLLAGLLLVGLTLALVAAGWLSRRRLVRRI